MRGHRDRLVSFTSGSFVCRYPSQTPGAEDTLYLEWGRRANALHSQTLENASLSTMKYRGGDPVHGDRTDPVPYRPPPIHSVQPEHRGLKTLCLIGGTHMITRPQVRYDTYIHHRYNRRDTTSTYHITRPSRPSHHHMRSSSVSESNEK